MKAIYFFAALFCGLLPFNLPAQTWQLAKRYSAPSSASFSNNAVANAPDGSMYIVGQLSGNVTFDTVTVSGPSNVNRGYLLKLDATGQAVWVQLFDEKPYHVTCDAQGNVIWGGAILTPGQADSLAIVQKHNATGQILATYKAGGTARSWVKVLKTDAAGNCYAAGWKSGEAVFGNTILPSSNSRDNFLVKLSPDLSAVSWAVQTGSSGNLDEVNGLDLDAAGSVYTSGNYSQTYNLFSCACYKGSFFTEKRSAATGELLWQKIFTNGSGTSTKQFVTLSEDGQSLYASASFKHTTQFSPSISLTAAGGSDDYHLFVANLSTATGNVNWAKKITLTGDSYLYGNVWSEDQLHLHGYFLSATLVGNTLLEPQGSSDAMYVKVAPVDGSVDFAEKFSGASIDQGLGIAADYGNLSLSGRSTSATLNIGTHVLSGSFNSIYVARRSVNLPLHVNITGILETSCPGIADATATAEAQGGMAPYSFLWSNGQTDSTAVMLPAGTYSVTVTDSNGTQASTSLTIVEPSTLSAGFSVVVNGLDASFTNSSTHASSFTWSFGDGQSSAETSPTHSYSSNGTYQVTLIAENGCGADTISQTISTGVPPNADFVADKVEVCIGDTVHFHNLSAGASSYAWEFPGADPSTSTTDNPVVVYTAAGVFPVTLTASNAFGMDVQTNAGFITVVGFPTVDFNIDAVGLMVTLHNNSQNANSFMWNFGDGNTSLDSEPTHLYGMPGQYVIQLTAQNQCGASILEHPITVGASATRNPDWLTDLRLFPNPNKGAFSLEMTGTATDKVQLSLYAPDGRMLSSEVVAFGNGRLLKSFEYDDLPAGLYSLQIQANGAATFVKVLVQY